VKIKLGQLKTHLSRYIRELRATGEPIEVCVREDTVAYLTPAHPEGPVADSQNPAARIHSLEKSGLRLIQSGKKAEGPIQPGTAAQPAAGENSIETIRAGRSW
jgi:antitoxin (DNA-binding transcriptional repressor) of toxin-antitoxin stability system